MRRPYPFEHTGYSYDPYHYNDNSLDRYYSDFIPPQYNRKRQRRQAAAIVVESLWNNNSDNETASARNTNGTPRRSTAQPRPVLNIPPKGIGPIADPNVNDVLCGRGGRINSHAGNVQFRDIIHSKKKKYLAPTTKKLEKAHIAAGIVNDIRTMNPPGRFLKEEKGTGMWYDIGDAKAIKKTGQALREDAPDIRPAIDEDGEAAGDEKKSGAAKTAENTGMVKSSSKKSDIPPSVSISPRGMHPRRGSNETQRTQTLIPILPQQYSIKPTKQQPPHYREQIAMPPPIVSYGNKINALSSQQQQQQFMQQPSQNQQGYQVPLQAPLGAMNSFPNQTYSGGQIGSNKFGSASRTAMEALNQGGQTMQQQQFGSYGGQPGDDMGFYDPNNSRHMIDDITISTISGLSEPLSSIKSGRPSGTSDLMGSGRPSSGASDLMNMSLKSNFSLTDSLRLKTSAKSGASNHHKSYEQLMNGSFKSGSNKSYDPMVIAGLNGSVRSGFGGSLTRSNSFPDNMNSDSFRFDGDQVFDGDSSLLGGSRLRSSAMSIGSIMDMHSDASSTQWFQAAVGNLPHPDDNTFTSSAIMSADLDALDLASTF